MPSAIITTLKVLTSVSSVGMCLSPAPSVFRIFRQRATGEVSIIPLVSLWASCHVWYVVESGFLCQKLNLPSGL